MSNTPWPDYLDQAAAESSDWYELGENLKKVSALGPKNESELSALVAAFQYDFIEQTETQRRKQWGPFGPMMELTDGRVYPMSLKDVPDEVLELWAHIANQSTHPAVTARLCDLLWERRFGERPDQHARKAADACVGLAGGTWEPLYRAEALVRGLELARTVGDLERQERIIVELVKGARASIDGAERQPGVALRLIESILRLPRSNQPPEIDDLLDAAAATYAPDPWILQSISDLQVIRAATDERRVREINVRQVEHWREAARRAEGLVRLRFLESALELARVQGLRDVADDLRREIQELTPEDLDLKSISSEVQIPREEIEKFHNAFLAGDDWRDCLERFGSYGPPSGDYEANLKTIEELQREHPLQFLFGKVILGPGNVPIRHANTEAEHREVELSEHEARAISFWALSSSEVLDRIKLEKDSPEFDDLTEFFSSSLISPEVAERFARAVALYWEGSFDESAHILVPRLEAVIREMCRRSGMAIIREPRGREPGGVRLLGDLLHSLKGRLDESWRRYLVNLLIDPIGMNLRNRISHALLPMVAKQETAVLIHAACFLRLLSAEEPSEGTEPGAGNA